MIKLISQTEKFFGLIKISFYSVGKIFCLTEREKRRNNYVQ